MNIIRLIVGILFLANVYAIFALPFAEIKFVYLLGSAVVLGVIWKIVGKPKKNPNLIHRSF